MQLILRFLLVATFVVVALIIVAASVMRYQEFRHYHRAMASHTVTEVSSQIALLIADRKRLIEWFGSEHGGLLERLLRHPGDPAARKELAELVRGYFPSHFSYALVDSQGLVILEDAPGHVGPQCLADVRRFDTEGRQRVRIHSGRNGQHFDVMVHRSVTGQGALTLLVGFRPGVITGLLAESEVPGHHLLMLSRRHPECIEMTVRAARGSLQRSARVTAYEQSHRLAIHPVPGTDWLLADHYGQGFREQFVRGLIWQTTLVLVLFALYCYAMWRWARTAEGRRRKAERARDEFVAVVSHELRTPLTSIKGALSLLASGAVDEAGPRVQALSRIALSNTERLRRLVDDLLDMRQIESGHLQLNCERVEIGGLTEYCVEQNRGYGMELKVEFRLQQPLARGHVWVDPQRFCQILSNLLSNAAKFSPAGAAVEVRVERENEELFRISVTDHGPGIAPEFEPYLFEKFRQGRRDGGRHNRGTGLGLSIARALVEAHGGHIGYHTVPGQGTTFYLQFPAVD